jgi:hypothetical protein
VDPGSCPSSERAAVVPLGVSHRAASLPPSWQQICGHGGGGGGGSNSDGSDAPPVGEAPDDTWWRLWLGDVRRAVAVPFQQKE